MPDQLGATGDGSEAKNNEGVAVRTTTPWVTGRARGTGARPAIFPNAPASISFLALAMKEIESLSRSGFTME
jgi:hypothetical protein